MIKQKGLKEGVSRTVKGFCESTSLHGYSYLNNANSIFLKFFWLLVILVATSFGLVLLVQNQTGLNNLFKLVSESYQSENFYRYPRIDYKLLKKYNEGIIAASACLGGVYAGNYWENREEGEEAVRPDAWPSGGRASAGVW